MSDPFHPDVPAAAYDAFLPAAQAASRVQPTWDAGDARLPSLFVSHGAPPTLDDVVWLRQLSEWALSMPKPKAILVVSAHWENAPLAISATEPTPLYYDFWGFHPRYYELRYDTPDSTDLAHKVVGSLSATTELHQHVNRGLDHGAFIPLMAMYPLADVPVLQLSMPTQDPGSLFALGKRLSGLRDEGVLIMGSGFATHSIRGLDMSRLHLLPQFNADFDSWLADALSRGDVDELASFRDRAPGNAQAHPSAEHYLPLLFALGAGTNLGEAAESKIEGVAFSNSKRSVQVA